MKIKKHQVMRMLFIFIFLSFLLIQFGSFEDAGAGEPVQVLINTWAWGIEEQSGCPGDIHSGWEHSDTVSLARCYKNPAPPDGEQGGSAFKNGPRSGPGLPGVETTSTQTFTLPAADSYTFTFETFLVFVWCDYFVAELYGDGEYLGEFMNVTPGNWDDTVCGNVLWDRHCSPELNVPYAAEYSLNIRTLFTASDSLGIKWTGLKLFSTPQQTNNPTSPPVSTASPTATVIPPTETVIPPTATAVPPTIIEMEIGDVVELLCPGGQLSVVENVESMRIVCE